MPPANAGDLNVRASLSSLELRFAGEEACSLALGLLRSYAPECVRDGACESPGDGAVRWTDVATFRQAISEIEDFDFIIRFPKAERMAWVSSLRTVPYEATLYRGERRLRPEGYASDPGDLGTGRYLSTCRDTAAHYGPVGVHEVSYGRAVIAEGSDLVGPVNLFYRTCRGADRVGGADTMRADFLEAGIDALVVHGYDSPDGHHTVVEFISEPPRPTLAWEEPEDATALSPAP